MPFCLELRIGGLGRWRCEVSMAAAVVVFRADVMEASSGPPFDLHG